MKNKKESSKALNPVIIVLPVLAAVIAAAVLLFGTKSSVETAVPEYTGETVNAEITIKDYGTIRLKLEPASAPLSVERFTMLAESGFYNGLTFHRIMEGFMMQGGDPSGNGTGGYSEKLKGEFSANGVNNTLSHTRGAISFARANDFDSASSQFFIVHKDSKFLDGQYAVFGYVTEGMDVVDAVCSDAKPIDSNGTIPPEAQPVIEKITITRGA